jgi:cysteine desulfurase/selenocysteine lyase
MSPSQLSAKHSLGDFDVNAIRAQFPILHQQANGHPLVYLDNAATTQKPEAVLQALDTYYRRDNSNVHRAVHVLAGRATQAYEGARERIAAHMGADKRGTVFTRGTTEAINLVARSFLQPRLQAGDEILVTTMEHHSNIVPWQLIAAATGARVVAAPVHEDGRLDMDSLRQRMNARTKLIAVVQVSNALGTVNPVAEIIAEARAIGVPVLVDGAQAAAHMAVDFAALDADFYAFSAHKLYGPTGFGVLLAKPEHLDAMPPWHGGGDMIETVSFEGSTWNEIPYKFEAGTPDISGAIGLAAAMDWIAAIGLERIATHEHALLEDATERLDAIPGLRIIGRAPGKAAIISFVMERSHPSDLGSILDMEGVAVRSGHHCTMPLMEHLGLPGTARASFAVYNTHEDVQRLAAALEKARSLFA